VAGVWQQWGGVLLASAIGLPLAGAFVAVLVRAGRPVRFAFAEVYLVAGTVPWLWMILTPDPHGARRVNLVPLHDLATLAPRDVVVQVGGNLLVFAALGALLPVRFAVGTAMVAVTAAAASVTVETLQYVLALGRVSAIERCLAGPAQVPAHDDDVLMNTLGAVLAAQASRQWRRTRSGEDARVTAPVR
jgi:VanZ like family